MSLKEKIINKIRGGYHAKITSVILNQEALKSVTVLLYMDLIP